MLAKGLFIPAYDFVLKCSHLFNLLDARRVISVNERANYVARVRQLANKVAFAYQKYLEQKESKNEQK